MIGGRGGEICGFAFECVGWEGEGGETRYLRGDERRVGLRSHVRATIARMLPSSRIRYASLKSFWTGSGPQIFEPPPPRGPEVSLVLASASPPLLRTSTGHTSEKMRWVGFQIFLMAFLGWTPNF